MSHSLGSRKRRVSSLARRPLVAIEGVEEPQRRVRGVVEALRLPFREQVRDQAVADVPGEGVEDAARLGVTAGEQRQPLEADHRVAPPVGEPGIAGDDGAGLVALGGRADLVGGADARRDDELIGGQHQLAARARERGERGLQRRPGLRDQALPPLVLELDRLPGVDLAQPRPLFGRRGEHRLGAGRDVELDRSEAPQRSRPVVAARALRPVSDVEQRVVVVPARRRVPLHEQPQRRQSVVAGDHLGGHLDAGFAAELAALPDALHPERLGRQVDAPLVRPQRQRRRQHQAGGTVGGDQPVGRRARCSAGG